MIRRSPQKQSVKHGNIMTPLNFAGASIETVLGALAVKAPDPHIRDMSFYVFVAWLIFHGGVYIFFVVFDRDRLQTESYNLENKALTLGTYEPNRQPVIKDVTQINKSLAGGSANTKEE